MLAGLPSKAQRVLLELGNELSSSPGVCNRQCRGAAQQTGTVHKEMCRLDC